MKEDASVVVVHDNENGKMWGPHSLLCVHASGDTPSPFTIVQSVHYEAEKWSLCLP